VHPRAQRRRKTSITGDDQDQPACPADPCKVAAQGGTVRIVVVTEHHSGQTAWQFRD
jgi:hypothetical protein